MSDSFKTNIEEGYDKRLYGADLGNECNRYSYAILNLMDRGGLGNDVFSCIIGEVMDLGREGGNDEGIKKGELHKRNRERFARGVFKAFFDEKIINEGQYDFLFKSLRKSLCEPFGYLVNGEGIKLRSGKVIPNWGYYYKDSDSDNDESSIEETTEETTEETIKTTYYESDSETETTNTTIVTKTKTFENESYPLEVFS